MMPDMQPTVLVADDDPHIRQLLAFALTKAGYAVAEAADGEEALDRVAREKPALVVLDINMPRMDGIEVCRRLRAEGGLPILFLSSRDDEIDRILGIELGADDYVTKPFSPREVVARVGAILRRSAAAGVGAAPAAADARLRHGRLSLEPDAWRAFWGEAEIPLTVTEFNIVKTLVGAPSRIFMRDALIDRLYGPGFAITDRTIDSHVRNLRAKFAAAGGHDVVETRAGVGYGLGRCLGEAA